MLKLNLNGSRTVVETKYWLAVIALLGIMAYETMLLPKVILQNE